MPKVDLDTLELLLSEEAVSYLEQLRPSTETLAQVGGPIFTWNRTDLSQFVDGGSPTLGAGTLEVATSYRGLACLRFTGTEAVSAGVETGQGFFTLDPSLFTSGRAAEVLSRGRWRIELTFDAIPSSANAQLGALLYARREGVGNLQAYGLGNYSSTSAVYQGIANGSSTPYVGTTLTFNQLTNTPDRVADKVVHNVIFPGSPSVEVFYNSFATSLNSTGVVANGRVINPPLPSTHNSLVPNTFGLFARLDTGLVGEISHFQIFPHPVDTDI